MANQKNGGGGGMAASSDPGVRTDTEEIEMAGAEIRAAGLREKASAEEV